ncbi:unnamed protein product, partial [Allacma fusca]
TNIAKVFGIEYPGYIMSP